MNYKEINSTYFTLKEISELHNKSHANLSRKAKRLGIKNHSSELKLGNRFIVHKDQIEILIRDERKEEDDYAN